METEEQLKHLPESTKKKISKSLTGSKNPAYKDGRRTDYRKKMGLKPGDPRVVDHKNGDRWDNSKSNLRVMTRNEHEKRHDRGDNFKGTGSGRQPPRRIAKRK